MSDPTPASKIFERVGRLLADDQFVEVRSFKADARPASKRFDPGRRREMFDEVAKLSRDGREVYFTLNPLLPNSKGAAKDVDVERRRLLLIDCDPERDADAKKAVGDGAKLSATDAEKAHATRMAGDIRDHLRSLGWPDPVEADSGNGTHLLYPIDLPNNNESRDLVKAALKALASRFDTADAAVDTTVYNASRITKFYGTTSRKGESTAERPHRCSKVLVVPGGFGESPVAVAQLRGLAASDPAPTMEPGPVADPPKARKSGEGRWTPEQRAVAYLEKCDPAISGQRGHGQAFKTACKIGPGFDLTPDVALILLREVYNPNCQPPWSEADLRHKVDEAYKVEKRRGWLLEVDREKKGVTETNRAASPQAGEETAKAPAELIFQGLPQGERDEIEVTTERHVVVAKAIRSIARDPEIYSRGDSLVCVVQDPDDHLRVSAKSMIEKVSGSPKVIALSDANIGCLLSGTGIYYRVKQDKNSEDVTVITHPPDWLIKAIATRKIWPGVRRLVSVAECPFPRPDGSIVETPGYDRETGTLYLPSIEFPKIPKRPTRADARAAWARIREYVREYHFSSEDDLVVFLAGMLTIIARPAIAGPVPGIAVKANRAGTGKGLLIDAMTIPGTGRVCPTMTYPSDGDEARKVKVAIALTGKAAVHFDNLDEGATYGSGALDSALTTTQTDERLLGTNDAPVLPLRSAWFLSGNNVSPAKDAYRRWLVIDIQTEDERPEERIFEQSDLRKVILDNRATIVRDVLTILRAHAGAGRPAPKWPGFGSFEGWSEVVRGAVWFATDRDCRATQTQAAEESPERLGKIALLEAWRELPGGRVGDGGITAGAALDLLEKYSDAYPAFRTAMRARMKGGKNPSPLSLGMTLRGLKNSVNGGYVLREVGREHQASLWAVESKESPDRKATDLGEAGEAGEGVGHYPRRELNSHTDVITSAKNLDTRHDGSGESSPRSPASPPGRPVLVGDDWTNEVGIDWGPLP